jgi:hypothetical protein
MKGDVIWHIDLADYRLVLKEQAARPFLDYRPVSALEIDILEQDREEELWGQAAQDLYKWIIRQGVMDADMATATTLDYIVGLRNDVPISDLIQTFAMEFCLENMQAVENLVALLGRITNEIPRWTLKGWTPQEVFDKYEKPNLQPLPDKPFALIPDTPFQPRIVNAKNSTTSKVGRNDPCPCGSGKKYKNCCLNQENSSQAQVDQMNLALAQKSKAMPAATAEQTDRIPPEDRQALIEAFFRFTELKPWEWMSDMDLFAVEFPGGEVHYGGVMGWGGKVFGLVIYLGQEGLAFNSRQRTAHDPEEIDLHEVGPNLLLALGDREELAPDERTSYADLGYRFRGRNGWPVFRRYMPGYYPWKLSPADIHLATAILEQALAVAAHCQKHRRQWDNRIEKQHELAWCMVGNSAEDLEKKLKWKPFPDFEPSLPSFDQIRAAKLARELPHKGQAWEMDWFYGDDPVQDNSRAVPWFPLYTLIGDAQTGAVTKWQIEHYQNHDPIGLLMDFIEEMGYLPDELLFSNVAAAIQLKTLGDFIGIEVRLVKRLQIEALKRQMLSGSFPK